MFFELIATAASGFCLAGLVMALRWMLRGRLPGWWVPAAAGIGMLSYAVWSEYTWLERASATLPPSVEVVSTNEVQVWYRPWTLAAPQVNRLIAIDRAELKSNPAQPGKVLAGVILMGRWEPTRRIGAMFDCIEHRRADLVDGVRFGDDGELLDARWLALTADDPVLTAACRGAAGD
jgi:hypothetical protein